MPTLPGLASKPSYMPLHTLSPFPLLLARSRDQGDLRGPGGGGKEPLSLKTMEVNFPSTNTETTANRGAEIMFTVRSD